MKVSLQWLRQFVPITLEPPALAEALSLAGCAVERTVRGDGDWLFELELTSNRPDCLSHYGVAREIAAITGAPLAPIDHAIEAPGLPTGPALGVRVEIDAPAACGRYCLLVLEDVTVAASPAAIAARLNQLGHRAINNIADLTNFTLWEMGHPTHAFDADRLRGGLLRVRWAQAGETLVTLDEVERQLHPGDLIIADAERPVALAGVMGGLETAIGPTTRRVALEAAWFDPLTVRRTARRHGLHTDASHRFERGADPEAPPLAARLIAQRAQAYGARLAGGLSDVRGELPDSPTIPLRPATLHRILGEAIASNESARILGSLGCTPGANANTWRAPSWRPDLSREIDLVEEIARLHGYANFPARLPAFQGAAQPLPEAALRDRIRQQLRGRGFAEAVTISFADAGECRAFAPGAVPVQVLNPLSEEAAILRTSSLPPMLHLLRNNLNHQAVSPKLFEIGKLYQLEADAPRESAVLSLGASAAEIDFAAFKGEVEAVLDLFDLFAAPRLEFKPSALPFLHPGRSAVCAPFAFFGQLHPETAAAWKLPPETWVAEIQLQRLYPLGTRTIRYRPPSRFPASERDFSFIFADTVTWADVQAAIGQAPAIPALTKIAPAEIFRGEHVGAGRYSLLVRARFQLDGRTLRDEEVQAGADEIVRRLHALGGQQR
ncbi:MAG TPA: phenylalanine--tRNA ligase subunit beta [Terriglobales bacterium]|jgi:phenylalanyl-tRNA synthetase beta chain